MKNSNENASYIFVSVTSNINMNFMRKLMLEAVIQISYDAKELQNIFTKMKRIIKDCHYSYKSRKYQFSN